MPTDEQVREALEANAFLDGDRWFFHGSLGTPYGHTDSSALAITRACLILDATITDTLTGETWQKVVQRLADLDERITRLEDQR
jgi:hypothetical protein